jgi:excisionase family DNA binding protein
MGNWSSHRRKMRTSEAATYTGLAKSTLEKLRVTGGGSTYMRVGRAVLYDPDDLDNWLAQYRRRSTSQEFTAVNKVRGLEQKSDGFAVDPAKAVRQPDLTRCR